MPKIADVIIDISHEKVDRPFEYLIPEHLQEEIEIGSPVQVPFGVGNRLKTGYVIDIKTFSEYPIEKLKEIYRLQKENLSVEASAVKLAAWMKHTYGSTMIAALKVVLPVKKEMKLPEKKKLVRLMNTEELYSVLSECKKKHQSAKERVVEQLLTEEVLPYELVTGKLHIAAATIRSLEKNGVLKIESESYYRNPVKLSPGEEERNRLSEEQQKISRKVLSDYDKGEHFTYLIHGITGSGKTEVYLSLIEGMIERGKQSIVLIPEIALTYQTLLRFYKRFGDRVSVMNSTLSAGEKSDQCERAKRGEVDVMIGPRSALFVPFANLGLIIMDEEHEPSYKSELSPKYHARETAQYLASLKGASLVLGSATPSLEAYTRAKNGEYQLFTLNKRLTGGELPEVQIVDLREELKNGNRSAFSRSLQEKIAERLKKREQVMLFLNRRGYAGFVSCRSCGKVIKCPHCEVSLSEHKREGKLVCHYCGYETRIPDRCPSCGSPYIMGFKAGTQQIEEQLHRLFPSASVLRMDADTTRTKHSYEEILSAFSEHKADILVGTQMIVKGHDFKNVTLVGILAADLSLNDSDYRCGERTFQLLTQAAGRAGRGEKGGEVILQTYQPDHYSIVWAAKQDYVSFYEEEILYRKLAGYPPVCHILEIMITSQREIAAKALSEEIGRTIRSAGEITVIGPSRAAIGKINDVYRFVIYCKHKQTEKLIGCREMIEQLLQKTEKGALVSFDLS